MRSTKPDIFLGRQPIFDRAGRIAAYELLYRSDGERNTAHVDDDAVATAHVVSCAFRTLGIEAVVGRPKAFINVDAEFLLSGRIDALPRERIALEILETTEIDEHVLRRCRQLKARGFILALDDFSCDDALHDQILDIVDIVKIDLMRLDQASLSALVARLKIRPITLLAEKVDTADRLRACFSLGFDLFQGFAVGHPVVLAA